MLLIPLQHDSTRPCHDNDPRSALYDWHHHHCRDWHESVSDEAGNDHHCQAHRAGHRRVRIAKLDEESFHYLLWDHKPLTDFWLNGPGTVKRLEKHGIHTMDELAYFSTVNQDILYKKFGVDAEMLIDHAWGLKPCGMK